ncbi:hypothetical protein NFI96_007616 [Prochilodus magdalenae]|nr:hypothetical protein NFI96_007616 [Prochilodus magdalenae]
MKLWLLLICCVCALKTSLSSTLKQSPETVQVSVGEAFTLECIHEIAVKYCYSTTAWHKVNKRTRQLREVREHGTPQNQDTDTTVCKLAISKATLQDSGMYYCTGLNNQMVLIGSGSRVIVNGKQETLKRTADRSSCTVVEYSSLDSSSSDHS